MAIALSSIARRPRAPVIIELPRKVHPHFLLFIAMVVGVIGLSVLSASVRITDRAVARAVEDREAPARFLAEELSALRLLAMTSASVVPARLYLGIEECFRKSTPVPFDSQIARQSLANCADAELGRLHAQGGATLERRGSEFLLQAGLSTMAPRVTLHAGNFERR